jgi:hypothetical protein|tara:strand:+ start:729 stop:1004 length:276 start_codon:yes stop_codon:yes gene_type:complete
MANGKYALGICDRTGFRYKIQDLVFEIEHGRKNGLRVGKDVVDRDHPQNRQGKVKPHDDQSIRDARPEPDEASVNTSAFDNLYPHTAGTRS